MVAKVVLDQRIGYFGNEIVIMGVHMHNNLANNSWPSKLTGFLDLVS